MAEELNFGIEQYKAGNKQEARRIFLKVIQEHPNYTRAYQWLYNVARDDNERMNILKKILEINPTHEKALKLFKELSIKNNQPRPLPKMQRSTPRREEPQKPAPKSNNLLIGIGAAIVIVICCMCVAIGLNGADTTTTATLFTSGYQVKYVVSGSARSAFVTYFNETGGTEQINANLPWSKEMNVELGAPLSLVAQSDGVGSITCEIWVNGEKKKSSTSTAEYGVVTCSDWIY